LKNNWKNKNGNFHRTIKKLAPTLTIEKRIQNISIQRQVGNIGVLDFLTAISHNIIKKGVPS